MNQKLFGKLVLLFIAIFALTFIVVAQVAPSLIVTNNDAIIQDSNNNGLADPGDVIEYTVVLANCGDGTAENVQYNSLIDANTQLNPDSITQSGLQPADTALCGDPVEPSAPAPAPTEEPAPPVSVNALAVDDVINVSNGATNTVNIIANDGGDAPITVISFGDSVANVGTVSADGVSVFSVPAGTGFVDITIDASGNIFVDASTATGSGTISVFYQIQAGNGTTDIGQIDITFGDFPVAQDDTLASLGAGNEYSTNPNVDLNVAAGTGLLNNDTPGNPAATLTLWGGGDASPAVSRAPGTSRPLAGGTLSVNADGSFDLVGPTTPGIYTFDYIIDNGIGTSQATVEIYVSQAPVAVADSYTVANGAVDSSNTVASNDTLGAPPAVVDFYANTGDIGGASQVAAPGTYTHPTGNFTVTIDGASNLTVDTTPATVTPGTYTFDYQITNSSGSSVATVTLEIIQVPVAVDDDLTQANGTAAQFNAAAPQFNTINLLADNGNGADTAGTPPFGTIEFGGGDLGGAVTDNSIASPGNATVTFTAAGGDLTLASSGPGNLTATLAGTTNGTDLIPGQYTFQYQLTNSNGTSAPATVTFEVVAPPTAQDDNPAAPTYQATVGNTLTIPVGATDLLQNTDPNGADDLGFPNATITTFGPTCTETLAGNAGSTDQSAGLTVNDDGSFSYTPTVLGTGTHTFCYTLSNGIAPDDTANVTILVVEAPIATDDTATTLAIGNRYNTLINTTFNSDGATFPHLMANDALGAPTGTLTQVDSNAVTVGTPITVANGSVTIDDINTGEFSFTPTAGFTGTASFTYTLTNINGTSTATVEVYVNQAPAAVDDNTPVGGQPAYFVTSGGGAFTYPAGALFGDNGLGTDTLGTPNAVITSFGPTTGAETAATGTGDTTLEAGILTVNADGSFSINPTVLGDHVFVYELENTDNNNNVVGTSTATVTIRVLLAPSAVDDTDTTLAVGSRYNTLINTNFSSDGTTFPHLLTNDTLGSPSATLTQVDGNAVTVGVPIAVTNGTVTISDASTGAFIFAPTANFTGQATFAYTIDNGVGTSTATVTVNVNQAPIAEDDTTGLIATAGGGNQTLPAPTLFNDNGVAADTLGFPIATITTFGPTTGAETIVSNAGDTSLEVGILTVNADGSFSINPTVAGDHTFVYTLSNTDSNGNVSTDTATVTVTVQAPPVAVDDPNGGLPNTSTPINDGLADANDNPYHTALNTLLTVPDGADDLLSNDTLGTPAATISAFDVTATNGGTVAVNGDGSFAYTPPNATFVGLDTFTYTLGNAVGTDTATVTVAVGNRPVCTADGPYPATGNVSIDTTADDAGANAFLGVLANDTGDSISITTVVGSGDVVAPFVGTSASGGTVTLQANGEFAYNPPTGFTGTDTFSYQISNGFGSTTTNCTVSIQVNDLIYFMDASQASGGDGSLANPYSGPADHNTNPPVANSVLFVEDTGVNTYSNATLQMVSGQRLLGEGSSPAGTLDTVLGITLSPLSNTIPYTTTGAFADRPIFSLVAGDSIQVNTDNIISGISVTATSGYAFVDNGGSIGTLAISESNVSGDGGILSLTNGGTLNATFTELGSTSTAGNTIDLDGIGGTLTSPNTGMSGMSGDGINIRNSSITADFGNISITNTTPGDGVNLSNNTGNITMAITGTNITVANGDALQALNHTGTITVNTTSALSGDLRATNGACADIVNNVGTTTLNINVAECVVISAPTHGIRLQNVAGAGFTIRDTTSISMNAGTVLPNTNANEAIRLVNTSTLPIDISAGSTVQITNRRETGFFANNIGSTIAVGAFTDANGQGATGNSVQIEGSISSVIFDSATISNTSQSQARILTLLGGINDPFPNNTLANRSDGHGMLFIDVAGGVTINGGTITNLGTGVIADGGTPTNQDDPSRFTSTSGIDARNTQVNTPNGLTIRPNNRNSGAALTFRNPPAGSSNAFPNLTITGVQGNANAVEIFSEANHNGATFTFTDMQTSGFGGASVQASDVFRVTSYPGGSGTLTLDIVGTNSSATGGANCFFQSHGMRTLYTPTFTGTLDLRVENCRVENLSTNNTTGGIGSITVITSNTGGGSFTADIIGNHIDLGNPGPGATGGENTINLVFNAGNGTENGIATVRNNTLLNSTGIGYVNDPVGAFANLSRIDIDNNTVQVTNNATNGVTINHNADATDMSARVTNNDIRITPPAGAFNANALYATSNAPGTSPLKILVNNNSAIVNGADSALGALGFNAGTGTTAVIQATVTNNGNIDANGSSPLGDIEMFIDSSGTQCFNFDNNTFPTPTFSLFNNSGTTINVRDVGNTPAILPQAGFTPSAATCQLPTPGPYTSIPSAPLYATLPTPIYGNLEQNI